MRRRYREMYGNFNKARYYPEKILENGRVLKSQITPKAYSGMFWGSVSNEDGSTLKYASDYFFEVVDNGKEAWDIINDKLDRHLQTHIGDVDSKKYRWQSGFGGDEMDGLLEFWLPTRIECPPDMKFEILGKTYVMSFHYDGGDKLGFSSEEED